MNKPQKKASISKEKPASKSVTRKLAAPKKPTKDPSKPSRRAKADSPTDSPSFRDATKKAESYAQDPSRLKKLFEDATKKSKGIPQGPFTDIWEYLLAMLRLIRAYYLGKYRVIPLQSLIVIIAAVIYFVSPLDAVPDWLPMVGYVDDVAVLGWALKLVKNQLEQFMKWEKAKS